MEFVVDPRRWNGAIFVEGTSGCLIGQQLRRAGFVGDCHSSLLVDTIISQGQYPWLTHALKRDCTASTQFTWFTPAAERWAREMLKKHGHTLRVEYPQKEGA